MDAVKIKLDDGAFMPKRAHTTDAGADIRTPEAFQIMARGSKVIHTGVHIQTPPNCATMIKSKSGLYIRNGVTATGVIDEGFTGEIIVKLINHGQSPVAFRVGDKIAQLVIVPVFYPEFKQVDEIEGGERGSNGYGSTGR